MVIGTSRCAHVLCYLFCWRVGRARRETRCARSPLMHPVLRRSAALARTLAAGSLLVRTSEWDAAMHPAPEDYRLGQRSRRIYRSQSTQPPLEAVRRPTLAFGNRHTSAPVHRCVDALFSQRPKSRAGSRLSLPSPNRWSAPPECARNWARADNTTEAPSTNSPTTCYQAIPLTVQILSGPPGRVSARRSALCHRGIRCLRRCTGSARPSHRRTRGTRPRRRRR